MPCVPIRRSAADHCVPCMTPQDIFSNSPGRRSAFPKLRNWIKTIYLSQVRDWAETLLFRQTRNRIKTQDMTEVRRGGESYPFRIAQSDQNSGYVRNAHLVSRPHPSQLRNAIKTITCPECALGQNLSLSVHRKRLITMKGQGSKQRRGRSFVMDIFFPNLTP